MFALTMKWLLPWWLFILVSHLVNCDLTLDEKGKEKLKNSDFLQKVKNDSKVLLAKYSVKAADRPTKCQACRVMTEELRWEMHVTNNIKMLYHLSNNLDGNKNKDDKNKIDYKFSEIRIMDILDVVCKNVFNYRAVEGPEFPYIKGVKSPVRDELEKAMHESGLNLNLDAPEAVIADPSQELKRLYLKCNQIVEEHEDDILEWYKNNQDEDPTEFICAERGIIAAEEQDCLSATTDIPDGQEAPAAFREDEKRQYKFEHDHKTEL